MAAFVAVVMVIVSAVAVVSNRLVVDNVVRNTGPAPVSGGRLPGACVSAAAAGGLVRYSAEAPGVMRRGDRPRIDVESTPWRRRTRANASFPLSNSKLSNPSWCCTRLGAAAGRAVDMVMTAGLPGNASAREASVITGNYR